MTDTKTHLERARTAWEAGLNQEMLRHILNHLEQPSTEERHKSLTLADLFEVCEQLAEDVRMLKFPPEDLSLMSGFKHLEKRISALEVPEAAPERATRVWRERNNAVKDGDWVTPAMAHESLNRFIASHFSARKGTGSEAARFSIPVDMNRDDDMILSRFIRQVEDSVQPSAVQGEERTAAVFRPVISGSWIYGDRLIPGGCACTFSGGFEYFTWTPSAMCPIKGHAPSSSPTATAQRGEGAVDWNFNPHDLSHVECDFAYMNHGRCTLRKGHPGVLQHTAKDGFQWPTIPAPLPAQTEPGEPQCNGRCRFSGSYPINNDVPPGTGGWDSRRFRVIDPDCPKHNTPQPPSPAPECAHEPDPSWTITPVDGDTEAMCLNCRKYIKVTGWVEVDAATDRLRRPATQQNQDSPSLPTEGQS